jgi:RNA polymerase sigma factor (sigma-70 family)
MIYWLSTGESALIEGIKRHDNGAFSVLVKKYGKYIYSICFGILKSSVEAEESSQDMLMKIIKNINDYNGKSAFKTWIYTIAYRTALDYHRKKKYTDGLDNHHGIGAGPAVELEIEMQEKKMLVERLLAHLDEESEQIVRLFYLEELSIKDIAEITGISESNIKVKLFRARKTMGELLSKNKSNE